MGRKKIYASDSERAAAHRAREQDAGGAAKYVLLDAQSIRNLGAIRRKTGEASDREVFVRLLKEEAGRLKN